MHHKRAAAARVTNGDIAGCIRGDDFHRPVLHVTDRSCSHGSGARWRCVILLLVLFFRRRVDVWQRNGRAGTDKLAGPIC